MFFILGFFRKCSTYQRLSLLLKLHTEMLANFLQIQSVNSHQTIFATTGQLKLINVVDLTRSKLEASNA